MTLSKSYLLRRPGRHRLLLLLLVVTRGRYIAIYIASGSTCSYVENWYIETISYMRYMGRSRYVGTSIELIVLVESIDETPK